MSKNRIIHNVQDVFIGSFSDEEDIAITGCVGYQVLKRLDGIQSVEYNIDSSYEKSSVLGKTHNISREIVAPSQVSIDLNYYLRGVNNEARMGLNADNQETPNSEKGKNIAKDIVFENEGRNLYIVINNDAEDAHHNRDRGYPTSIIGGDKEFTIGEVGNPYASGYSVIIFQNCYLNSHSSKFSLGTFANASVSYTADNVIAYSSASGIDIPYLDLKKGEVTNVSPTSVIYESDF